MAKEIGNARETLNLQDLLVDDQADLLSDYLSVSIESLAEGTKVSVTTVEDNPVTYSSTLSALAVTNLQYLVDGNSDIFLD
ncbi:MAG: hypothetical protein GQ581_04980 [Methyloprofundus sp.]|nr:hypothetical protein [Methyloprofundus sp.]